MDKKVSDDYVVIDLEMTGLKVKTDAILEVGAVRVRDGVATETFSALLNARHQITDEISQITGITREMMERGEDPLDVMPRFFDFLSDDIMVGHNVIYDYSFLKQWAVNHDMTFERNAIDTLKVARKILPDEQKKDLKSLCAYYNIIRENEHRALDDALATAEIFERMKRGYDGSDVTVFEPHPLLYKVKKQTPATATQMEYLRRYAEAYGLDMPEYAEMLTRSEASRIIDKWIFTYGRIADK